jgi:ribonuclease P protein component
MPTVNTLGKNERIKSRKQIEYLFASGQRFHMAPFRASYTISPAVTSGEPLQFGIGVGTRNFKKAVDRNRVKRLTREAWRLQKNGLKEMARQQKLQLHVFLVYTGKTIPEFTEVKECVASILSRFEQLIQNNVV